MSKLKSAFFCQNCGVQSPKWVGKCSSCDEWNTYIEEVIQSDKDEKNWKPTNGGIKPRANKPNLISDISPAEGKRLNTSSP